MFILGMRTDDEQSKVPFVSNRMIVGIPAFAILFRGWYPPFAEISIICFPSTTLTLSTRTAGVLSPPSRVSMKVPPMRTTAMTIDMVVAFINAINIISILKIKDGRYETNYHQAIDKVEKREHDHDQSSALEEYSCL